MAILTAAQIARFCADAGWAGEEIVIAVAVCLAESSGNTEAYNPEPDFDGGMESHAYGLWQIEWPLHQAEISLEGVHDARQATEWAYGEYVARQGRFTAWQAYTDGVYVNFMDEARAGAGNVADAVALPEGTTGWEKAVEAADALRIPVDLDQISIAGKGLGADLTGAVIDATVDLSDALVSQLTITIDDPGWRVLGSGVLDLRLEVLFGSTLRFEVAALDASESAGTQRTMITCRAAGPQRMRKARSANGKLIAGSYTDFVALEAIVAGMSFIGEPTPAYPQVGRTGILSNNIDQLPESSWEAAQRMATTSGFVLFEAGGTLYFARPHWLADRVGRWKFDAEDPTVWEVTGCHVTEDDLLTQGKTIELVVDRSFGQALRPGQAIDFSGVPLFEGRFLVSDVQFDVSGTGGVRVRAKSPIDPRPDTNAPNDKVPQLSGGAGSATPGVSTRIGEHVWEWPVNGVIPRPGGEFGAPRPGHIHAGLDIAADQGTRIIASRGGTCTTDNQPGGAGQYVTIDHHDGYRSLYMHMSAFAVHDGAEVSQSELIGYVGDTGDPAPGAYHCHFEIRLNDTPLDPEPLLNLPPIPLNSRPGGRGGV